MKQRNRVTPKSLSNDNTPPSVETKDTAHGQAVAHLYVQDGEKHGAKKSPRARGTGTWTPMRIYTDLPADLPVLPDEIALLRGFMGDLVSRIIANDNDPL